MMHSSKKTISCLILLFLSDFSHSTIEIGNVNEYSAHITPLPQRVLLDKNKVLLGKQLFNDKNLSGNRSISCATCHRIDAGGDDDLQFSINSLGESRDINTPTIFNVIHNFEFTWKGGHTSLYDFYEGPLFSKKTMNNDWDTIVPRLSESNDYLNQFKNIYSSKITKKLVLDALITYQNHLVTPNSRFDQYLRGDSTAISKLEVQGYRLFKSYGCISCHQGKNIGGNMYQKFGIHKDYFSSIERPLVESDYGLYNRTKQQADRFYFRVPSLRNVAQTAPYLHDGSIDDLSDAIKIMATYQLGRTLNPDEVKAIRAFLDTLSGNYQEIL